MILNIMKKLDVSDVMLNWQGIIMLQDSASQYVTILSHPSDQLTLHASDNINVSKYVTVKSG